MVKTICVAGAGTMGRGIALSAAQNNFEVILFDTNENGLENAKLALHENLDFLVGKQKITTSQKENIYNRILFTTDINVCICDVFIEAIVEKMEAKVEVFNKFCEINNSDIILASNTSSLSITTIQKAIKNPERICGMHFFNPANIMKLVEVVKGEQTSTKTINTIYNLCLALQKTPVLCNDAPGFIVNRVARHYYLEAMLLASEKNIDIEKIDLLLENAGFKMGPFKLMDLIGLDVNYAVSQSVYEAFDKAIRFTPSPMQATKVAEGKLGKKTNEGFYIYPKKNAE